MSHQYTTMDYSCDTSKQSGPSHKYIAIPVLYLTGQSDWRDAFLMFAAGFRTTLISRYGCRFSILFYRKPRIRRLFFFCRVIYFYQI